jgi:hypothetical protein
MNAKTIVLALAATGCAAWAPAQFGANAPMHGKKAQGAIVIHDRAKVYDKKDSAEVKHTLKRGAAVAGWHREAIVTVYEFEEENGRVRVLFPNPDSAKPFGGWMNPEDLAPFTYDCGCEVGCIPWKASFGPSKFNLCFQEARDEKLEKLREKWEREGASDRLVRTPDSMLMR